MSGSMARVRLIHWNLDEAAALGESLEKAGHAVEPTDASDLKRLARRPPDIFVISLDRLPSHGREVGLALRESKKTRHIPLLFAGGADAKVAKIKAALPDAVYTPWSRVRGALRRAIANPPKAPIVPSQRASGYSGTPLPRKLGIKPEQIVALVRAPKDFESTLGTLPEGVTLRRRAQGRVDLAVWFPKSASDLAARVPAMDKLVGDGTLWICWPKKASGVRTDLSDGAVRDTVLRHGLVDSKSCAIDETYSGLRFTRRR